MILMFILGFLAGVTALFLGSVYLVEKANGRVARYAKQLEDQIEKEEK